MEKIQLASLLDSRIEKLFLTTLSLAGYDIEKIQEEIDPERLVLVCFDENAKEEDFLSFPWLKKQNEFSSYHYLRVMPLFVYRSSISDPEEVFEEGLGDEIEAVFSGEFKPFGFDYDNVNASLDELKRVIEESYLE